MVQIVIVISHVIKHASNNMSHLIGKLQVVSRFALLTKFQTSKECDQMCRTVCNLPIK